MSVRIIKPGFLATLQDSGRYGFQSSGVSVSGAMDDEAMRMANIIVGNDAQACCIEFTLHGAELEVTEDSMIALCGGGTKAVVGDKELPFGKAVFIRKNLIIKFLLSIEGCRSYLSIAGGFNVEPVLGSRSTYLSSQFGGLEGRALRAGDEIGIASLTSLSQRIIQSLTSTQAVSIASWGLPQPRLLRKKRIRVFKGPEHELFTQDFVEKFLATEFTLSAESNRMGFRLDGKLSREEMAEMISTSVTAGTIQSLPNGSFALLMADRQTTGGYPRIAQVAWVDLGLCAQLRIGETITFTLISFEEAENLFLERHQTMQEYKRGIATRFSS